MSKHTPGPWFVRHQVPSGPAASTEVGGCFQILDNQDTSRANVLCTRNPFPGREDEMRANARLMGAAPDLLVTLKELVAHLEEHDERNREPECPVCAAVVAARAAIAKAEGSQA